MPAERPTRDLGGMLVGLVALNVVTIPVLDEVPAAAVQTVAAVGAVVIAHRRGYSLDELGLSRTAVPAGLRLGGALSAAVILGVVLMSAVPFTREFLEDDRFVDLGGWRAAYEVLVRIPIATALSEELLFRSVLLAVLLAMTTTTRAVVVSSLVFGSWHVLTAVEDLGRNAVTDSLDTAGRIGGVIGVVTATSVAGAIFAWTRLRSGSVVAPWMLHAVVNGATYTAGYALAT